MQGKDAPWFVYRGTVEEIKAALAEDFEQDAPEGLSLSAVVNNAQRHAEALSAAKGMVLAPVATSASQAPSGPQNDEAQQSGDDPWTQAEMPAPAADPLAPLREAIEAAVDRAALKLLYAENQAAFTDADLLAAWKTKGKSLPA
jgi:hypothetical protein